MKNLIWIVIAGSRAWRAYMLYSGRVPYQETRPMRLMRSSAEALEKPLPQQCDAVEATEGMP